MHGDIKNEGFLQILPHSLHEVIRCFSPLIIITYLFFNVNVTSLFIFYLSRIHLIIIFIFFLLSNSKSEVNWLCVQVLPNFPYYERIYIRLHYCLIQNFVVRNYLFKHIITPILIRTEMKNS